MTVTVTPVGNPLQAPVDPLGRVRWALNRLAEREEQYDRRQGYADGQHGKPFVPPGVDAEYRELQAMSPVPLIATAMHIIVQRLRVEAFLTDPEADAPDVGAWRTWQESGLDALQSTVYAAALAHREGIVSVWPRAAGGFAVRVESPRDVYLHRGSGDPFAVAWAVKRWTESDGTSWAMYADDTEISTFQLSPAGEWVAALLPGFRVQRFPHGVAGGPFYAFRTFVDSQGNAPSWVESLIPQQRAIDTINADMLLAAQFAAYRQRIVTNYDPILKDDAGQPIWKRDQNGELMLDSDGQPIPQMVPSPRLGVDRLLIFDGEARVTDLQESNLSNYQTVKDGLIAHFAATAHIPAPYLAGEVKNVASGASETMERTLIEFVRGLQTSFGQVWEQILAAIMPDFGPTSQVLWREPSLPQTLSAAADGVGKLVQLGFPLQAGIEMLPGMTPWKVQRVMRMIERERGQRLASTLAAVATVDAQAPAGFSSPPAVDTGTVAGGSSDG